MPDLTISDLVFAVYHNDSNHGYSKLYGHTKVYIEHWKDNAPHTVYRYDHVLAHFKVTCQYDNDAENSTQHQSYAWSHGMSIDGENMVTLAELERYIKPLRAIEKKLESYSEQWGNPSTFGQLIVHLMKATGIKRTCWRIKVTEWRPDIHWRLCERADSVRTYLDDYISQWHLDHDIPTKETCPV